MTDPSKEDLKALEANIAELRGHIESMEQMAKSGLDMSEPLAQARGKLADAEARIKIEGDVHGDAVSGNKSTGYDQHGQRVGNQINIAKLYKIYQKAPDAGKLDEDGFKRVLVDYLDWVIREYGYTRLHGLQSLQNTGDINKPLNTVYTSLAVRHRPAVSPGGYRRGARALDMAKLLTLGERVAIIGGAGSGKTTYLSFVASSLALTLRSESMDSPLQPPYKKQPDKEKTQKEKPFFPVPLLAPLRFWNVYQKECAEVQGLRITYGPEKGSLGDFLLWVLQDRYKNFDASADFFARLLRGGQGCLILLDGLDEVVNIEDRRLVRDETDRLLRSQYPGNRCLVTAREAGYRDAPFGDDYVRCDIQPMDEDQISSLIRSWCDLLYLQANDRQKVSEDLNRAISELNEERKTRDQTPLVSTPLMVTMVVSVKYSRHELPRERAKLYDAFVDMVLRSEYTGQEDHAGARRMVVHEGGPPGKQREWLSILAFHMHKDGEAGASVTSDNVHAILESAFKKRGEEVLLKSFIKAIRHRGGLFEERGSRFQFMHLTFQEYLAAQHLAGRWHDEPGFIEKIVSDKWWREVLLLTVGSLGPPATFDQRRDFIKALCSLNSSSEIRVAGAELAVVGLSDLSEPEPALKDMIRDRLLFLAFNEKKMAVSDRVVAGRNLAIIGDPRDLEELVTVQAGQFWMGCDYKDKEALNAEKPKHRLTLPVFKIGKYPVTQGQFANFVKAAGYEDPKLWTEDGWRQKRKYDWIKPKGYGFPFHLSNHPVVGVSWYEAIAYCKWLTNVWRAEEEILDNEEVRLPTEAEWEKAARGADGRIYPWGDEFDAVNSNTKETDIVNTCAVGIFPNGASPSGVLDMSGNVCEWTCSLWGGKYSQVFEYPYKPEDGREDLVAGPKIARVLRGGSNVNIRTFVRCASRGWDFPYARKNDVGFRVFVSPISPTSVL